eukprot:497889-Prorocentrum_minimum.AAC.1
MLWIRSPVDVAHGGGQRGAARTQCHQRFVHRVAVGNFLVSLGRLASSGIEGLDSGRQSCHARRDESTRG